MKTTCQIIHGKNEKILPTFAAAFADLTVTSPPYDDLRTYGGLDWDFQATARELYRITKPGGVVVWIVGDQTKDGSESLTSFKQAIFFRELGFLLHDTMIFEKHNFSNPSSNRYHQIFEFMFVFSKGQPKTFNPIKDIKNKYTQAWGKNSYRDIDGEIKERRRNVYKEYGMRRNIWRFIVGNKNGDDAEALEHPAIFPEALAHDHIISWSNPGDVVVDPFCGSGTVGKMAIKLGRSFVGIDSNPDFVKLSEWRTAQRELI